MLNDYIDNIFENSSSKIKFDEEQKRVICDEHNNCLVIAGAGCGKTTVISAKVKYLIDIKKVAANNILVLSFTRESVNDLKKQINELLDLPVSIKTFHQLGLEIIKDNNQFKICDNLKNVLNDYFRRDIFFTNDYLFYLEYLYTYIYKDNKQFYKVDDKLKVTSLEEVGIVNVLKLAGVNFKYKIINFNNIISKFIFSFNDKVVKITYLKHRKLKNYSKNNFSIVLIKNEKVLEKLVNFLLKIGINNFNNKPCLNEEYDRFLSLCCSFINNYKVMYTDNYHMRKLKAKYINNYQLSLFLNIISKAYNYYQKYNINNHIMDFNDIINNAIVKLKETKFTKYHYVIIDEAQDISKNRFEIIKLLSKNKANIILFGDDWQAIFGFAGSNVNLFINVSSILKNCCILKITKTYRNSKQLIALAGNFIMKNKYQLAKKLQSDKSLEKPVNIYFYDEHVNKSKKLYELINEITIKNIDSRILIIGRYNFSIKGIIDNEYFALKNGKIVCLKKEVCLTYLTAHASKGLTYDEVIILDANDEIYGFPSKVIDTYELSILKEKENYYLEEERRLFYVALTRTKNHNYIFSLVDKPSTFILELLESKNAKTINLTKKKISNNKMFCKNCGFICNKNKRKNRICPQCKKKFI